MEIEAKFAIPSAEIFQKLQMMTRLGQFSLTLPQTKQVHDTYLDTEKRKICQNGYAFRQREQDNSWLMTLKSLCGKESVIRRREELEIQLPTLLPILAWPPGSIRSRLIEITQGTPLVPLFNLDQTRYIRMVNIEGREVIELSLDEVHMVSANREEIFFVLEAELISEGNEADLATTIDLLQREWHLTPEECAKLEHAQAFFNVPMVLINSGGSR